MSRKTFISDLPSEVRGEVNIRLREAAYGGQIELTSWLNEQGYRASKSGVNRYAMALRKADGIPDGDMSHDIIAKGIVSGAISRKESILIEIGKMRIRELELINEWNELRD